MSGFEKFLEWAEKHGWRIEECAEGESYDIPEVYRGKLGEFEDIIKKYRVISNPGYTAWLVLGSSLSDTSPDSAEITWDYYKSISIDAADGDDELNAVNQWWDRHFPFLLSVDYGYEFYAVNTEDGSVVYACEPMFEDGEKAADSIDEFFAGVVKGEYLFCFQDYFDGDNFIG
ncbi:MAG: hypothetical protein MR038_05995 [Oscillospiraceae bacterium]|nr:hypothetical protein [Oscillospiraceae bacterium]